MRDKITIFLLVLMALWFLGSWVVVPILKLESPGGPALAIDDVREANYLPPYVWPEGEVREASIREVVYGPLVTETYTKPVALGTTNATWQNPWLDSVVEVQADETAELPDGRELRVRGIRIVSAGLVEFDAPTKEVFVAPNGEVMTPDQVDALMAEFNLLNRSGNDANHGSIGFRIQVLLEADFEWKSPGQLSLRDSLTGATPDISGARGLISSYDGSTSKVVPSYSHNGVRPTPLVLIADLWHAEVEVLKFEPNAPQTIRSDDKEFDLISVQSFSQERVELTTLSGEDLPHQFTDRTWDHTRVTFDRLPEGFIGLEAILKSGEHSRNLSRYGNEFRIRHPFDEIEALEIEVGRRQDRVVIHLPDLPIFPEWNRGLRDVRKMVFPTPTIINTMQDHDHLLRSIMQTHGGGGVTPTGPPPNFPWDVSGWTVDRFLETTLTRYAEHDFVMEIHDHGLSSWQIRRVGETRRKYRPLLAGFYDLIQRTDVPLAFFLGLIALRQGWITMRSRQLLNHLRALGYASFGFWNADRLNRALGRKAWGIPAHDELGSIPGVDPTSVKSIIDVMRRRRFGRNQDV